MRPFLHAPRTTRTLLALQVFTQHRPPGIWRRGARTGANVEVLPTLGTQPPAVHAALRTEGDCQDHFLPDEIVQDHHIVLVIVILGLLGRHPIFPRRHSPPRLPKHRRAPDAPRERPPAQAPDALAPPPRHDTPAP